MSAVFNRADDESDSADAKQPGPDDVKSDAGLGAIDRAVRLNKSATDVLRTLAKLETSQEIRQVMGMVTLALESQEAETA